MKKKVFKRELKITVHYKAINIEKKYWFISLGFISICKKLKYKNGVSKKNMQFKIKNKKICKLCGITKEKSKGATIPC